MNQNAANEAAPTRAPAPQIIVVGAGPAGLSAAVAAAECGARITILEQLNKAGARLLATGGGRCNLTNILPTEEFMAAFGRQGRFMQPALQQMDAEGLRAFMQRLGVPTHAPDGLHVFPVSDSAQSVRQVLLKRLDELGARFMIETAAETLALSEGKVVGVKTAAGVLPADAVILATGGMSYPSLGGGPTGYTLATHAGHSLVTPEPALVPLMLTAPCRWLCQCHGVAISDGRIWIDLPRCSRAGVRGDMLITHTGLSGPAVLDISGEVAHLLTKYETVPVRISLKPDISPPQWLGRFDHWQRTDGAKEMRTMVSRFAPASLAGVLTSQAGIAPSTQLTHVTREQRAHLAELLGAMPLEVSHTAGFDEAMVTRGGVSLKEVEPHTLQSRRTQGLFFAGEVLDLDGPCGGFNLQWAFASGFLAGQSAAKTLTGTTKTS